MERAFGIVVLWLTVGLIAILSILWLKSLHCGDFSVRGDAQFFYLIGAHQLDGYDHDGKACEENKLGKNII